MKQTFSTVERYARYGMSIVAIVAVAAGLGLRFGWISKAPFYHHDHWYLESSHSSFVIISEYDNEAECRKHEKPFTTCRSGKAMSDEARLQSSAVRS